MNESMNRRHFVAATAAAGVGLAMGRTTAAAEADKPALLGDAADSVGAVSQVADRRTRGRRRPCWPRCTAANGSAAAASKVDEV